MREGIRKLLSLMFMIPAFCCAQQHPYVGYSDTVIYANAAYRSFGYEGATPVFVKMWFPLDISPDTDPLKVGELSHANVPENLSRVLGELERQQDTAVVQTALTYELLTYQPIHYADSSERSPLERLESLYTESFRARPPAMGRHDVVVYHHGTKGTPEENRVMAEYFASRGFVFISASYHLPFDSGRPFGWESFENDLVMERRVMEFAREWAGSYQVAYIGHSWGAQLGWCLLHEPGLADAFISLETTLEFKKDMAEVADKWPHMARLVDDSLLHFGIPILAVAWSDTDEPLHFFRRLNCQSLTTLIVKTDFDHESYTSVYHERLRLRDKMEVPDTLALRHSVAIYDHLLKDISCFLEQALKHQVPEMKACVSAPEFLVREGKLLCGNLMWEGDVWFLNSGTEQYQIGNPDALRTPNHGDRVCVNVAMYTHHDGHKAKEWIWILSQPGLQN